jgi:hypothetical protein
MSITMSTKNEKIVFWPDSASAHYAKNTLVRLEELKIQYVRKQDNPTNVLQIRPIENFWANLKRKVYSNNYRPKYVKYLMAKIRKELKSIETTGIRKVIKEVLAKTKDWLYTVKIISFNLKLILVFI